jgi:hypothetical protein
MRRREFISLLGLAPIAAKAQQMGRTYRLSGLGKNLAVEWRAYWEHSNVRT